MLGPGRARAGAIMVLVCTLAAACHPAGGDATDRHGAPDATTGAEVELREVAYGDAPDQVGDLIVPAGPPPDAGWPVVVLVHGGFWREAYHRDLMDPLAEDLRDRGYVAWNVEYRRVGGAGGWPATLLDLAAAVDHLADVEVPLDLDRVAIAGHSAGGHLALWVAGRTRLPDGAPGTDPRVRPCAAVGQAPVADLAAADDAGLGDGAARELLGGAPQEVPDRWAIADPVQLVGHGVPVLLVHGTKDDTVPTGQSERYADAAARAGDPVEVATGVGDHFAVIDPADDLWGRTMAFLDATC